MNLKRSTRNPQHQFPQTHLALLDTVLDSYVHWRHESRAVQESYRSWQTARRGERSDAFARYVAALDREEHAANGYRRVAEQTHA
jgi:hypothetical protein